MARYVHYQQNSRWVVEETATSQVIATTSSVVQAATLKSGLNLGRGFGGETPSFFVSPSLNLDTVNQFLSEEEEESIED